MLKIWWPSTFFDLQTNFIIHLIDELKMCGHVGNKWCYPIERYLHVLKKYVRNQAKPKSYMTLRYIYDEALRFTIEYFALYPHTTCRI